MDIDEVGVQLERFHRMIRILLECEPDHVAFDLLVVQILAFAVHGYAASERRRRLRAWMALAEELSPMVDDMARMGRELSDGPAVGI